MSRLTPLGSKPQSCDDTETMYRPAIYKITSYKPLDDQSELDLEQNPRTSCLKHRSLPKRCSLR